MAYTDSVTFDNLSLHAFTLPAGIAPGKVVTLRQDANAASQVAYDVAAPNSTNNPFRKLQAEPTQFNAPFGKSWQPGDTLGYIQPVGATVTFQYIVE